DRARHEPIRLSLTAPAPVSLAGWQEIPCMSMVLQSIPRPRSIRLPQGEPSISLTSRFGLNAANFFLAEVVGVVVPFLSKYLVERGWTDGSVGMAIALGGLGVFLMQT